MYKERTPKSKGNAESFLEAARELNERERRNEEAIDQVITRVVDAVVNGIKRFFDSHLPNRENEAKPDHSSQNSGFFKPRR